MMQLLARPATVLLALPLMALAPGHVVAQSAPDAWQWQAAIYGWFPGIRAHTEFPSGASGPTLDVSAQSMVESLKMAAMGSFGGKKGRWGFWSDLVYSDVGGSKVQTRDFELGGQSLPASLTADLSVDMKSVFWTVSGSYELAKSPSHTTDLMFGARLADIRETLDWSINGNIAGTGLPSRTGKAQVDMDHWDGVVGIKGVSYLDAPRRWLVAYYADIGAGQSKFTWQANLGIGYRFDWGSTVFSWRYLDYQMKSGVPITEMSLNGALLGMVFQF